MEIQEQLMAEVGKERRTGANEAGKRRRPGRLPEPPLSVEEGKKKKKKKREEKNRKDREYRAKKTGNNNNSKNQPSESSTTVNRKRKRSASPAGRTEDILPILKKLASPIFDYLPTNKEVKLTDLVDFLITTAEPPVEMVKKNMSTPEEDEWEDIAEEYNDVGFTLKEDEDEDIDIESTRKHIEELSIEPENRSESPMMEVDEIQDDY